MKGKAGSLTVLAARRQAAYGSFNQVLSQQAAMLGVNAMFSLSSGIFVALISCR
jgi:hypothetical protein